MTTRYRVEYALKTHRRDQLIEWIKGLLAVPFVLHSQPAATYSSEREDVLQKMAQDAHRRYLEIFRDVELLIKDHSLHHSAASPSRLKHLVPTVGTFFTALPLPRAFEYQDKRRHISSRRFVAPSFNDIRLILNTAQLLSISSKLQLVTFDGDLTLYADGTNLVPSNPVIPRLLSLLSQGIAIAIVTAAGYTEATRYYERLAGLLDAIQSAEQAGKLSNPTLLIMGGEANYLFKYNSDLPYCLQSIPRTQWLLPEMVAWTLESMASLLDVAETALKSCIQALELKAQLVRKDRAVGIIPSDPADPFSREQLEETVLVVQQVLEGSEPGKQVPFCAFNGGNDVFVDIGDKSWGVLACQRYLGGVDGARTLHVGDQFLSGGGNDFKARLACTTAWIASPAETVRLLDELAEHASSHSSIDGKPG